jgi:hypothetical protein
MYRKGWYEGKGSHLRVRLGHRLRGRAPPLADGLREGGGQGLAAT